jgi:hypothetical protein
MMNHSSPPSLFGMTYDFNESMVSVILRASGVIMRENKRFFVFTFGEISE